MIRYYDGKTMIYYVAFEIAESLIFTMSQWGITTTVVIGSYRL